MPPPLKNPTEGFDRGEHYGEPEFETQDEFERPEYQPDLDTFPYYEIN